MLELGLPLAIMLGAGFLAWRWFSGRSSLPPVDDTPDSPVSFGYKIYWLAVPSLDTDAVVEALGRADPRFANTMFRRCNWRSAFDRIQANFMNREVFISPPVDGWVFCVNWMPPDETDETGFQRALEVLSDTFGEAYSFGSHRVVGLVAWAVARDGEMVRAFAEADFQTMFDFGSPPPEEAALDLITAEAFSDMDLPPDEEDAMADRLADEDVVVQLASAWTLDPTTLGERDVTGVGWIARPAR